MKNAVLVALIVVVALFIVYQYDSTLFGLLGRRREGFADAKNGSKAMAPGTGMKSKVDAKMTDNNTASMGSVQNKVGMNGAMQANTMAQPANGGQKMVAAGQGLKDQPPAAEPTGTMMPKKEGFADLTSMEGPANFASVSAPAGCYPRDQLTPSELLPGDQNTIYAQQNPMGPGSLKGKNFLSAGALIGVNTVGQSLRNANLQLRSEPPNPQVPVSIFLQSTIQPDISHRPLEVGA